MKNEASNTNNVIFGKVEFKCWKHNLPVIKISHASILTITHLSSAEPVSMFQNRNGRKVAGEGTGTDRNAKIAELKMLSVQNVSRTWNFDSKWIPANETNNKRMLEQYTLELIGTWIIMSLMHGNVACATKQCVWKYKNQTNDIKVTQKDLTN